MNVRTAAAPARPPPCAAQEFELTLDVDRLVLEVDKDRSGDLDFSEFASILQ